MQTPLELRFDIERYRVEGNTLLSEEVVQGSVAPYAGKGRDFGDVQRALEALERAYRERGYSAVQVYLPEQELARGEVLLRVIEARLKNVQVRGNKFFDEANVRWSLPALQPGSSPNANAVAKNLRLVNENPAKQTNVTLRAGAGEGEVDAVVEVADENPRKWFVTFDNTGTPATGYHRAGLGYQNANVGGADDTLTLQYITSVEKPDRVSIYSAGYRRPFYGVGGALELVAGYSDVDAGSTPFQTGSLLAFSGRGGVVGARYNWQLQRIAGYDHRLTLGLDHRMYRNSCTIGGADICGPAGATFSITPLLLSYGGMWLRENAQIGVSASAVTNLGWGGSRAGSGAIDRARPGGKVHYALYRFGASYARALGGDWQVRARVDAQYSNDMLVAPEQFGVGGANSVRGFLERERADDRGHSGSLELYSPELAPRLGLKDWNLRLLAFYDFGRTARVNPQPGEQVHNGIASAGLGLRTNLRKSFALRLDVAQILDEGGTRQRNHQRFALGAVWSF